MSFTQLVFGDGIGCAGTDETLTYSPAGGPAPGRRRPMLSSAAVSIRPALSLLRCGALAGLLAALSALAAPEAPADPLSQWLGERALLAKPAAAVQSVRDSASELVMSAMNFLGMPYRRGGSSDSAGFDCSGFTRHVFEMSLGLVLPRRADEQAKLSGLTQIKRDELKPGDLVFFNTLRRTFSHVGIYLGDGKFIHSPRSGAEVRIEDMGDRYWSRRFTGARRADAVAALAVPTPR